MIPVWLKISGFLSYRSPVEVDFSAFDVACISGHNGAGKSTLLDAMTWVLFGQARRRDDALINNACKAAEVILDFDYENNRYRVQRSKARDKTALLEFFIRNEAHIWRPLTEHSLRETEERIQAILRMDYETFINASFFLQGKADQFAQQRPGDRKRILANVLGLEIWETYREETAARRKQVEKELTALDGQLQEIDNDLSQETARRERLAQLENDLAQLTELRKARESGLENHRRLAATLAEQAQMVALLKSQLEETRRRLDQRETLLTERRTECTRYEQQIQDAARIESAFTAWQNLTQSLHQLDQTGERYQSLQRQRAGLLTQIESESSRLSEELRSLQIRQVEFEAQAERLPEITAQFENSQRLLTAAQEKIAERARLNDQFLASSDQIAGLSAENKHLHAEMDVLAERRDRLEQTTEDVCPICGQPLGPQERSDLLASLTREGKTLGDHYRDNQKNLADLLQQQKNCKAELDALAKVDAELHAAQRSLSQAEAQLEKIHADQRQWQEQLQPRLAEVSALVQQRRFAEKAQAELAQLDSAVAALAYDESRHAALRAQEQELHNSQNELRALESARAALSPVQREIDALQVEIEADRGALEQQTVAYQTAQANLEAQQKGLPDIHTAEDELAGIKSRENFTRMQVGAARQKVDDLGPQKQRRIAIDQRRSELTLAAARYKTLERAFSKDGVPALLIEQALPEIQDQANEFLHQLSNDTMSVEFSTQRGYKDHQRDDKRETLDILINDPAGTREYEMFSGGEAFRVNFAIRLALSRVLSRRAGARLQTLVIDEGFGSQDNEGRQRLIEAINLVRPDFAKILVITHLEELKDAFPARIEVEKTNLGSSVQVWVA